MSLVAGLANAHTYLSHVTLDGKRYDEGVCIKPYPQNRNFPVKDPSTADLTCGFNSLTTSASKSCPVAAGSTITVEWHHDNDQPSDDVIAQSHWGPCIAYMAPLASGGKGNAWFKVFEDGYNASTKTWCTDRIRDSHGKLDIKLPADIKAGDYLLRTEVIALHEADTDYTTNSARGAQYYPNCAQVSVSGNGQAVPQGYPIPGIYKTNSPGILFNLYASFSSYPIPGPPVYTGGSPASNSTVSPAAPSAIPTSSAPAPTTSNYVSSAPPTATGPAGYTTFSLPPSSSAAAPVTSPAYACGFAPAPIPSSPAAPTSY
ncbi:hypothetical protein GQ54DRAFT_299585 [Martensiomyces pterosporus]|nr:hypothetical protein GQ54DRAFT_299585 [Martensiomyces pterosporus]